MTHGTPVKIFVVAGVVIRKDGKYLLVQEKQPKAYKLWNWPAGKVDEGYSIEQTAVKEAKEECGFDVALVRELAIWHETAQSPVQHVFEANIIGGKLAFPEDEILDARWFSFQELQSMKDVLRGKWILAAAALLEKKINIPPYERLP